MDKCLNFDPVIKWTGSKRSQVSEILSRIPDNINTYYEPFCGGSSVLMGLILSGKTVNRYVCSDINNDLINLWKEIKCNPIVVADNYEKMWHDLNDLDDDKERKKSYFNMVRDRFNRERSPYDFMFIMRTTTNGMPRYNKNGDFNNSYHITRNGIQPDTLRDIIFKWSTLLNDNNVEFVCQSYLDINTELGDFIYLDPPYANTKGIYHGGIDLEVFWMWLRNQKSHYILSFDGKSGEVDNTHNVPNDLFSEHLYLKSGNSSFKRTIGKSNDSIVFESLYVK